MNVNTAAGVPAWPTLFAMTASFCCSGVSSSTSAFPATFAISWPSRACSRMQVMSVVPVPICTSVPQNICCCSWPHGQHCRGASPFGKKRCMQVLNFTIKAPIQESIHHAFIHACHGLHASCAYALQLDLLVASNRDDQG